MTVHFESLRPSTLTPFDRPLSPMTVHFRPDPRKLQIFQQHSFHFRNVLFISATFFLIQQHSYYFSNILFVSATFQGMLLKIFSATCSARWVCPSKTTLTLISSSGTNECWLTCVPLVNRILHFKQISNQIKTKSCITFRFWLTEFSGFIFFTSTPDSMEV